MSLYDYEYDHWTSFVYMVRATQHYCVALTMYTMSMITQQASIECKSIPQYYKISRHLIDTVNVVYLCVGTNNKRSSITHPNTTSACYIYTRVPMPCACVPVGSLRQSQTNTNTSSMPPTHMAFIIIQYTLQRKYAISSYFLSYRVCLLQNSL